MAPSLQDLPLELGIHILRLIKLQDESYQDRYEITSNYLLSFSKSNTAYGRGVTMLSQVSKVIRVMCMSTIFEVSSLQFFQFRKEEALTFALSSAQGRKFKFGSSSHCDFQEPRSTRICQDRHFTRERNHLPISPSTHRLFQSRKAQHQQRLETSRRPLPPER